MIMRCIGCGRESDHDFKYCPYCGRAFSAEPSEKENREEIRVSPGVSLCTDGKYRWKYEMSLFKNPTIFIMVWKIFFFIILGIFVLANIADAVEWGDSFWEHFCQNLRFFGVFLIGMTVLSALGYLLYAAIMGGKYIVLFEMDERGVNHKQLPKQAKKARRISELTMLAGAATGNPSVAGIGINSARSEMYSEFKKVRSVKPFPRRDLIKVNERFGKNQVYASKQDFDFVLEYILSHVTILET